MVAYGLDTTYSSIHPVLAGDNPDNSFSELPYERGFQTLVYLESLVGSTKSVISFAIMFTRTSSLQSPTLNSREPGLNGLKKITTKLRPTESSPLLTGTSGSLNQSYLQLVF